MKTERILLDHGSGGKISHRLVADTMLPIFDNAILARLDDGAVLDIDGRRLAFSTDTYTVDPIFFPGGNIGDLAVNGTVNDLAMCGATPLFLSVALIIEEGFAMSDLDRVLRAMRHAALEAGVQIVTGDTKVVPKGAVDKIFINTSGVGTIPARVDVSGHHARLGDRILLSGSIADHGVTVLIQREGLSFDAPIESDSASLNRLVDAMLASGGEIHTLRDPTRGGLGTTLNEIALQSGVGMSIEQERIPIKDAVAGVCELLGFDPMYVANEGKLIAIVAPQTAPQILTAMKNDPHGREACIIGEVVAEHPGTVFLKTPIGGSRILDMLTGEQLPRIC